MRLIYGMLVPIRMVCGLIIVLAFSPRLRRRAPHY